MATGNLNKKKDEKPKIKKNKIIKKSDKILYKVIDKNFHA